MYIDDSHCGFILTSRFMCCSAGKNGCCSYLRHLSLSGCVNISDATVLRLAMAFNRPAIKHDAVQYNNDNPKNKVVVPRVDCLCEEYYQTYGRRLTENSIESATTGCGKSPEVLAQSENAETRPGKCDGAYDEDKDIDEVAIVTETAVGAGSLAGSCSGIRTFGPQASQCHSCCAHAQEQEQEQASWLPIEDCHKVRVKPVVPPCSLQKHKRQQAAPLQYLNLSGCFQVTDLGLRWVLWRNKGTVVT